MFSPKSVCVVTGELASWTEGILSQCIYRIMAVFIYIFYSCVRQLYLDKTEM